MKLKELIKKASTGLYWQDDPGAGLQLYGFVKGEMNCGEFTMNPAHNRQLFTLRLSEGKQCVCLAHDRWIQFMPNEWDSMQKANAALMTHAVRVLPALVEAIEFALVRNGVDGDEACKRILEDALNQANNPRVNPVA